MIKHFSFKKYKRWKLTRWTMDTSDADEMIYEYTVYLDGELSSNRAELKKI